MKTFVFSLFIFVLFLPRAGAWGGRGHTIVCEASIYLIKDRDLKSFLLDRAYILNHLCLVPDVYWRGLQGDAKVGNSTHFLNHEKLLGKMSDAPLNYKEALARLPKTLNQNQKVLELGSSWWRADQFFRRAVLAGKDKSAENFLINIGLMGHFIADNGVAFHVVEDFDGRKTGQSGLHEFYESRVPSILGPKLLSLVVASAEKEKIITQDLLPALRELAVSSLNDVPFLVKSDPVLRRSFTKEAAIRKLPEDVVNLWKPVIIKALGRSAALMARSIEEAYRQSGKPDFKDSYVKFPLTPEFIQPDYFDL